jgi:hypothetical protein
MASLAAHAARLPDAPAPQHACEASTAVPNARPNTPECIKARQWSDVVNPGETVPTLTAGGKLLFSVHQELSWTTPIPLLVGAEFGNITNGDPKYGSNGADFGKRVGVGALYQTTEIVLTDGLLPIAFHQDPRYYRQAYGDYKSRGVDALRQVLVSRSDSGGKMFNFSGILGRGMSAALTQTYYPERSVTAGVVMKTWGYSILSMGGVNEFHEFWPDIKARLFHKNGN